MSAAKDKIRALVDAFVGDLDRLIREAVWETAQASLGVGAKAAPRSAPARGRGRPRSTAKAAPAPKAARKGRRRKGEKRNPADITKLTERLLSAISSKPGQRMEHLGKTLGASTAELQIPVARLLAGKKITRKGEKRATKYFPSK
jgi:hypothetical protein